jgi:hypothetical protein
MKIALLMEEHHQIIKHHQTKFYAQISPHFFLFTGLVRTTLLLFANKKNAKCFNDRPSMLSMLT